MYNYIFPIKTHVRPPLVGDFALPRLILQRLPTLSPPCHVPGTAATWWPEWCSWIHCPLGPNVGSNRTSWSPGRGGRCFVEAENTQIFWTKTPRKMWFSFGDLRNIGVWWDNHQDWGFEKNRKEMAVKHSRRPHSAIVCHILKNQKWASYGPPSILGFLTDMLNIWTSE